MQLAEGEWGLHIYALLMGQAQMVARRLPPKCQLYYIVVLRAVLERAGLLPEEHRQQFHTMVHMEGYQLFTYAQQLLDPSKC